MNFVRGKDGSSNFTLVLSVPSSSKPKRSKKSATRGRGERPLSCSNRRRDDLPQDNSEELPLRLPSAHESRGRLAAPATPHARARAPRRATRRRSHSCPVTNRKLSPPQQAPVLFEEDSRAIIPWKNSTNSSEQVPSLWSDAILDFQQGDKEERGSSFLDFQLPFSLTK